MKRIFELILKTLLVVLVAALAIFLIWVSLKVIAGIVGILLLCVVLIASYSIIRGLWKKR